MVKLCTLMLALLSSSLLFAAPKIVDLKDYPLDTAYVSLGEFNGSREIGLYLAELAEKMHVDLAFETGTWMGGTTAFLSQFFTRVYTVEILDSYFNHSRQVLQKYPNVKCYCGSSETILHQILPLIGRASVLFYLDAHGHSRWPLLDELEEISLTHKDNCIVVIDDFKVPGRPDISYDFYGEHECSFEYIHEKLDKVFTDYTCFYLIPKHIGCRAKFVAYPKAWNESD